MSECITLCLSSSFLLKQNKSLPTITHQCFFKRSVFVFKKHSPSWKISFFCKESLKFSMTMVSTFLPDGEVLYSFLFELYPGTIRLSPRLLLLPLLSPPAGFLANVDLPDNLGFGPECAGGLRLELDPDFAIAYLETFTLTPIALDGVMGEYSPVPFDLIAFCTFCNEDPFESGISPSFLNFENFKFVSSLYFFSSSVSSWLFISLKLPSKSYSSVLSMASDMSYDE